MLITDQMIQDAKYLIATGEAEPVGYRILVKSIFVDTDMDKSLKDKFPELASMDFQDKSEKEATKQSKGTYYGIVCDLGFHAFGNPHLGGKPWLNINDVAIFERYAGVGIELPPGSGEEFRFMNDENIMGRMTPKSEA